MELHLDFVRGISWPEGMKTVVRVNSFRVLTSLFIAVLCWCFLLCPFWNRWWSLQSDRLSAVWFYSRITRSCSKFLRHFCFISHHFCSILHHFCFGYKILSCKFGLKSYLWFQTKPHSTQFNYHYKSFQALDQISQISQEVKSLRANPYVLFPIAAFSFPRERQRRHFEWRSLQWCRDSENYSENPKSGHKTFTKAKPDENNHNSGNNKWGVSLRKSCRNIICTESAHGGQSFREKGDLVSCGRPLSEEIQGKFS